MKWNLLASAAAAALIAGSGAVLAQATPDQMQMNQQKANEHQDRATDMGDSDQMKDNHSGIGASQDDRTTPPDRTHAVTTKTTVKTLTTVQKTRIRTAVIERPDAPRINHVNFTIRVGVAVPRTVRVVPVPEEIVAIYPQWAGFNYFIDGDQIVVVDPNSFAIVGTFIA